jgi:hypothetical protein
MGTWFTALFLLLILYSVSYGKNGSTQLMPEAKYVEFLETAAALTKANYENISTWQGEFRIEEDNYYYGEQCRHLPIAPNDPAIDSNSIRRSVTGFVKFVTDIPNNKLYTELVPIVKYRALDLDKDIVMNTRYSTIRSIVTSDEYLSYEPNHIYASDTVIDGKWQPHSRAAFRRSVKEASKEQWGEVRDPSKYFFQDNRATWDNLYALRSVLTGDVNSVIASHIHISITEEKATEGTKYHIKSQLSTPTNKDASIDIIMTLDSSVGFNLTSRKVVDRTGKTLQTLDLTYEEINGLYLPKSVHFVTFSPSGQKPFDSQITFTKSILNMPIPAETFTYKNLGLEDGNKFIDKILDKEYIYQGQTLIEVTKKGR